MASITCTDTGLYRNEEVDIPVFDNKLRIAGQFCTTDPADVVFPLKVLFVIDTSQSMNTNDPVSQTEPDPMRQTGRAKAISDVVAQYINLKSQVVPTYCNTGITGCEKGKKDSCAACGGAGFMCIGPDCCLVTVGQDPNQVCRGVPICPSTVAPIGVNGTCMPLCDVTKAGCTPSETNCPDCPEPGDRCLGGLCGNNKDPGVEFALMRFGSAKQVLTKNSDGLDGFTNDVVELVSSIPQVSNGGSVTDYEGALSMAYKVISADVNRMIEKNAAAVNRTKYVVIFLSDGEPYPRINDEDDWETVPTWMQKELLGGDYVGKADQNGVTTTIQEYNLPSRILQRVQDIMSLKTLFKLGDVKVHTAFLAGNNPSWVEDEATYLLKQMAQLGKGTFRSFPNGEDINFLHVGFSSLRRVFKLKNFIASNLSAYPYGGNTKKDSDNDGLRDDEEVQAGTNVAMADSDQDGFSDLLEHFYRGSGWDALDPADADCPIMIDADNDKMPDDTDGDGLLDCEERFMGTSRTLFDSDADGIPDGVEARFGTNAVEKDVDNDLDFDGMPNGDEIRLHTDPRADDAAHRSRISYRYHVKKVGTGIETVGLTCSLDADCPTGQLCKEKYCRCVTDDTCSSQKVCANDTECPIHGEKCEDKKCKGTWTCQSPDSLTSTRDKLEEADNVCADSRNITCYDYEVENIALVSPKATQIEGEPGWNTIHLYFGEAPFDNPGDYGNYKMACIKAWYNDQNGSKNPATGKLTVPETAWKNPTEFSKTYLTTSTDDGGGQNRECGEDASKAKLYCNAGDACIDSNHHRCRVSVCLCPDGQVGLCK
jgi:hypothetical protein